MLGKAPITALEFASQLPDLIRAGRSGSLIEYTRATRVEPIVLMDSRSTLLPYIEDILNSGLNIFSAYYLQAVALSVNVGKVDVLKLLEKLNPNRDPVEAAASGRWSEMGKNSLESYKFGLPFPGQSPKLESLSQEDSVATMSGQSKIINDQSNLAVGKLLEVTVENEGQKATFPIQVRLITNSVSPDVMSHILSLGSKNTGIKERWHLWRSGQIEFVRDLIFCQDLIDQHKQAMMKDSTGYYKARLDSRRQNGISAILSGNPSVATASSIYVLTTETAKEVERNVRGRLKDFNTREKLFKETYAMMMFVIDPDWEQVTIYHRSIEQSTEVSVKELQRSNKSNKGPDILEILNAFRQNKSPTI